MSKIIMFSRVFPAYHPKKNQPTHFVEKLWESIYLQFPDWLADQDYLKRNFSLGLHGMHFPKHHTIRAGNRWKVGDKFSPRVWSDKPYRSKQITIAPDIEVKKVWNFEIVFLRDENEKVNPYFFMNHQEVDPALFHEIAINDGLLSGGKAHDLFDWFIKSNHKFILNIPIFSGQIICWNEKINYCSDSKIAQNSRKRKVVEIINGSGVSEFNSVAEAEKSTGLFNIGAVCKGVRKNTRGRIFEYKAIDKATLKN